MIINNKFLASIETKFVRININSQNIIPLLVHYLILIPFLPPQKKHLLNESLPLKKKIPSSLQPLLKKKKKKKEIKSQNAKDTNRSSGRKSGNEIDRS